VDDYDFDPEQIILTEAERDELLAGANAPYTQHDLWHQRWLERFNEACPPVSELEARRNLDRKRRIVQLLSELAEMCSRTSPANYNHGYPMETVGTLDIADLSDLNSDLPFIAALFDIRGASDPMLIRLLKTSLARTLTSNTPSFLSEERREQIRFAHLQFTLKNDGGDPSFHERMFGMQVLCGIASKKENL
jgi:hypothetical protein